jgi:hypothetical protein
VTEKRKVEAQTCGHGVPLEQTVACRVCFDRAMREAWEQGRDAVIELIENQTGPKWYELLYKRTLVEAIQDMAYPAESQPGAEAKK